ncbi:YecA/YgfB family protein, partial [Paraburkholderia aspalathi]|uniref:YecA/YgfB family protein n=1 Tax=Paraburkholderia aspalathi TaxID=1324617 RepID=UPI00190DFFCB
MTNLTLLQPLTDDEFTRLAGFLDVIGTSAMNIETLDGYFAALICGPDMVLPSEYLPEIWGEEFSFDSDDQATEIMSLLMRHWNTIAEELRLTLDEPNVYLPVLLEGADGVAPGNDWAHGFMRGVQTRPESWSLLINDEDHGGAMLPIMMLHYEHDPAPEMRPPPIA